MANHKSSEKRARSDRKKAEQNSQYLSAVKTAVKRFRFAVNGLKSGTESDLKAVETLFSKAQAMLSKAAQKGYLHKNNASRKVARLASAMKDIASGGTKAAAAKPAKSSPAKKTAAKKAPAKKTAAKKK